MIKAHGSTKAKGFLAAIEQAMVIGSRNIIAKVEKEFEKMASLEHLQEKAEASKEIEESRQEIKNDEAV